MDRAKIRSKKTEKSQKLVMFILWPFFPNVATLNLMNNDLIIIISSRADPELDICREELHHHLPDPHRHALHPHGERRRQRPRPRPRPRRLQREEEGLMKKKKKTVQPPFFVGFETKSPFSWTDVREGPGNPVRSLPPDPLKSLSKPSLPQETDRAARKDRHSLITVVNLVEWSICTSSTTT